MLPSLILLVALQGAPAQPTAAVCDDVQRIELSLERGGPREICVSPGLLTAFVFDSRVVVDLEEEVRFAEVTRGNTSFAFMPPGDGLQGERFRLTVRYSDGGSATFLLVLHKGRATRQVEVYRDKRTRESFQHEVDQERAKVQQLQQQLGALQRQFEGVREECGEPFELRRLISSRTLGTSGLRAWELTPRRLRHSEGSLTASRGVSFRSNVRVAVEVWLRNPADKSWTPVAASLVDAKGKPLRGVQLWVEGGTIPPGQERMVVVEAAAAAEKLLGAVTLSLREEGPRGITIQKVPVPEP